MTVILNPPDNKDGPQEICIVTPGVYIKIMLKDDYGKYIKKNRNLHIIRDIEDALNTMKESIEFKKLVDSYE